MNRVIIIGNGFDKAHGLATGYRDFIDSYWTNFSTQAFKGYRYRSFGAEFGPIFTPRPYVDELVSFEEISDRRRCMSLKEKLMLRDNVCTRYFWSEIRKWPSIPYEKVRCTIALLNKINDKVHVGSVSLTFKNKFFEHISGRSSLTNWVDIENEYYGKLKGLLAEDDSDIRNEKVRALNQDFDAVKKRLESYLTQVIKETQIEPILSIREAFSTLITTDELACGKQKIYFDHILNNKSHDSIILNFNYTQTAKQLYAKDKYEIINIHGELGNRQNPIIFGYGDELDDDYKRIEKLQDNDFLENIKSVRYHETDNYRRILGLIESEDYQVVIMGHSCGNSDRTLLNTLFEHPNCISVKVFYHQLEDGTDNYSDLIRNLSRNFNDKVAMRDKVVNKKYCLPLVPIPADEKQELPNKE